MSRHEGSTVRIAEGLYFRVRDGYGCNPLAMVANNYRRGVKIYKGFEELSRV